MPEVVTIGSTTAAKHTMGFNVSLLKGGTISQTIVGAIISGMVIASTVATILMVSLISYQSPVAVNDTATTYKNVAISINVLSNDYDPKGNNITLVQLLTTPSYGSAYISSSSAIVYQSNGTYSGNDTFSYQITNGYLTSNASVLVSVVNRPPEAVPIAVTVSKNVQNTLINIFSYVGDNDEQISDPDSVDTITALSYGNQTIVSGTANAYGLITIDKENGYYYSPADGFNGVETFAYTITDGYDTSSSTITVTVSNDAPTAVDDSYKIPKYSSAVLSVLSNDYDVNGDDFNITSATGTGYGATVTSDKSITYIATGSTTTKYTDSFEYTITDGVATGSAIVVVTVYNTVPVVYSKTVSVAKSSTNNSISVDYYDADRRDLVTLSTITPALSTLSPVGYLQLTTSVSQMFFDCCEWLNVDVNNYTILFTPTSDTVYTQTLTVVMSDGEGTGTGTITINVVNTPPVAVDDSAQCNKNQQVYVNLVENDYDENSGDTAKIKLTSTNWNSTTLYGGSLTLVNSTHALYVAPSGFLGTDSATYVITDQSVDSSGNADSTSFATGKLTVTVVNNPPTPVDDSYTISKGVTASLSVLDNDSDPNDGSGSVYIINSVTASSVKNIQASIVSTSGAKDTLSYAASNAEYTDYLTYDVTDQDGATSTYKATVTLYVVNDAPVAYDDSYSTLWNRSVDCAVKSNDYDKNGDLSSSTISIASSPSHGSVTIVDSVIRYTPTNGYVGTDTFTYKLNDGSSSNYLSNVATVTITVYNTAPVTVNDTATSHWRNPSGILITPLSNDSDPDGDALIISSASADSSVGTVTLSDSTTLKFVPTTTSATTGTKTLTYYAYDYNKKTLGYINVAITNTKPTATGESYSLHWAASSSLFSVMDNDGDADSDTISLYSVSGSTAAAISGSYIQYTPKKDGVTDTFQYVITDTVSQSDAATVSVSFTNSDTPSASNVATSVHWRTFASQSNYQDFTVLSKTTDADGDTLTLSVTTTSSGLSGSSCAKTSDTVPKVRALAPTKTTGSVACSYSISDGLATTGTKTATLTITNSAPTCSNMSVSFNPSYISTGQNYSISSYVTDADSNDVAYLVPASATIIGSTYSGDSFTVAGSYLNFKPSTSVGTRTYAYTVTDGLATSSKCYVSIIVSSLSNSNYYQSYDVHWNASSYEVPILTNLATSTIKAIASQSYSTVTLSGGKIYFTPLRQIYVDTFTITVTDSGVDSPVYVTITTYNNAPTASLSTQTIAWGTSKTVDLLTNYADTDYTAGRESKGTVKSIDTSSTSGTVSSLSGSSVTYTAPSKYVGSDTFKVTATDGLATVTFTVTFTMTNNAPVTNTKYFSVHWATHKTGYQMNLSTGVTDVDGDSLTYSVTSSSISPTTAGSVALSTSPYAVATASSTVYLGAFTFTYGASDSIVSTPGSVSVTVYNNMSTPIAASGSCHWKQTGVTLSPFSTFAPTLKDVDGDSLSLVSASAQKGTVSVGTSTISYSAPGTYVGTDVVTYKFTDGAQSLTSTNTVVNVNVYNTAPVCVGKSTSTLWGSAVTVDLSSGACTDADSLDTAYFNGVTSSVVGGSVSVSSKKVTYTPSTTSLTFTGSNGYYTAWGSFQFQCTDGMSTATNPGTVNVTVYNNAPTGTGKSVSVNRDYTTSTYDFTWAQIATATDADGDTISYTNFASSDSTITVSNIGTGIRLTTSNKLVSGSKTITFKLYDGLHYSTSSLTFTVTFVNTAPVCIAASVSLKKKGTVDLSTLYNATDSNSDPVTYALVSSSVSSTYGSVSGSTYTASSTTSGSTSVSYTATDGQDTTTCSISIVISNQIPVADDVTYQIVPVSTTYTHKFTYTATDGDSSDTLTYTQTSTTCTSLVTALNISTSGLVTFIRKAASVNGTCTMSIKVVDNNSPTVGQDTATITFVISSSSPTATDDRFSITQGQTIRIYYWQMLQNDYDEFGSNTTLTFTSISCPSSSYCHETPRLVTANGLGAVELDSDSSTCQADSFQYTMTTALGTTKTATVYVEFTDCYCTAKIDFMFLLDSSGSIGSTNFNKMRSLAKSITGRMSISTDAIMVSIAKFHSNGTLALALSSDGTTINNTLTNMAYEAGSTATIPGLRVAVDALRPANGGRSDADKVIFILTDGLANVPCSCSSCVSEYQAKPSIYSNTIQTNILGKYTSSALTTQLQNICKYQYTDSTVLSGTTCSYCSTGKTAYCLPCADSVPFAQKINSWQRNSTGIVPNDLDNPYNGNNNVQWKIVAMAVGDAMSNTYGARQIEGMNYDSSRAMTVSWTDLDSTMSEIVDQSCNQVTTTVDAS